MLPNSLWRGNSTHSKICDELSKKLPDKGRPDSYGRNNKALERFRKAQNAYYDLYNNGLFNKARSFSKVFGIKVSRYVVGNGEFLPELYELVEVKMNSIIEDAAREQLK